MPIVPSPFPLLRVFLRASASPRQIHARSIRGARLPWHREIPRVLAPFPSPPQSLHHALGIPPPPPHRPMLLLLQPRRPLPPPPRPPRSLHPALGIPRHAPHRAMLLVHEPLRHAAVQQLDARIEEATHVDQHHRTEVEPQPLPRDGFEEFLQRAASARQRDRRPG